MTHDHPTAQVLAELADGLLAPAAAAEIEGHTATCAECQQTMAELVAVASQLRDLPAEVAMPADVTARMSAAIEREVDVRAENLRRVDETIGSGPVAWFRRRLPQALVATSVAGLLVVFGSVIDNNLPDGGGGSDDADTAADGGGSNLSTTDESFGLDQEHPEAQQRPAEKLTKAELRAEIERVWADDSEFGADCGRELADEQGQELVGSTELGTRVLIVLKGADVLNGWVVPACASRSDQAVVDMVEVPTPGR